MGRKNYVAPPERPLKTIQPAPVQPHRPKLTPAPPPKRCFFDLPAELRIEIYRLALQNVRVRIKSAEGSSPSSSNDISSNPHPLLRTSRQIRLEVLPLIQTSCPILATVNDFDFGGLLTWLHRIPPHGLSRLAKNGQLAIKLCTTKRAKGNLPTLRRWLHSRADPCIPQPDWKYTGLTPEVKIANDLRRRVKRMPERKKAAEFRKMLGAIGVNVAEPAEGEEEEEERHDTPI